MRWGVYLGADLVVICFSLVKPASLACVRTLLGPEAAEHGPTAVVILVGCQSDARDELAGREAEWGRDGLEPIFAPKGEEVKREIKAHAYLECSAKCQRGVKELFEAGVRAVLHRRQEAAAKVDDAANGGGGGGCCVVM
jgi:GTPase SAR1 family protein